MFYSLAAESFYPIFICVFGGILQYNMLFKIEKRTSALLPHSITIHLCILGAWHCAVGGLCLRYH